LINAIIEEAKEVFSLSTDAFPEELPDNQRRTMRLEQVATYIQRGVSPDYDSTGDVLVVNQKCIKPEGLILEAARYLANRQVPKLAEERFLRTGDVLLNSTGEGTLGRSTVVESMGIKAVVDSHVTIIRPNPDVVLPQWIDYFLKSAKGQEQIHAKKTGSTKQTELGRSSVLGLQLIVPDVKVQSGIVVDIERGTRLSSFLIEQLKGIIKKYELLFSHLLKRAFTDYLSISLPREVMEEFQAYKAYVRERQQQALAARRHEIEIIQEQSSMEKIELKEATDLTQLVRQHVNKEGRVDVGEFWQLIKSSGLEIDTFYAYLKVESTADRIKDVRESHRVYLELGNEVETVMD